MKATSILNDYVARKRFTESREGAASVQVFTAVISEFCDYVYGAATLKRTFQLCAISLKMIGRDLVVPQSG